MPQITPKLPDSLKGIVNGCIMGNRASQAKLYHLYANKMMGVCMWYCHTREEAEEVLQDGFMRVFKYVDKYSGEGSLEGWIRKIMVNVALSRYRNKSSKLWPVMPLDFEVHDSIEAASIADNYDAEELLNLVRKLPPAYQMVFNLHIFEGFKHKEIAAALGISEGTSKSNLADARRILQSALAVTKKIASK